MNIEIEGAEGAPQELVKYASETGLEPVARQTLVDAFRTVFAKANEAIAAARGVAESVVDATCVTEIRKSRACRLAIRAVRIEAEKIHKAQKEHAVRFGKAVDGFKNILLAEIAPVEEALQAAEDTAERAEAARKGALKAAREAELIPLMDGSPIVMDLSSLTEEAWSKLLASYRLLKQAKIEAAQKAEAERLAREEEARRVAAENERLKREALEREAAAKAEREEAERKLAAERAESARITREAKAKADAEAKAAAEKAARDRAAVEAKAKAEREAVEAAAREEKRELEAKAETERRKAAKAQAEAKALRDAEEKRKAQEAAAALKAAAAPDRIKVRMLAGKLRELATIDLDDEPLSAAITERVNQLADWLQKQGEEL